MATKSIQRVIHDISPEARVLIWRIEGIGTLLQDELDTAEKKVIKDLVRRKLVKRYREAGIGYAYDLTSKGEQVDHALGELRLDGWYDTVTGKIKRPAWENPASASPRQPTGERRLKANPRSDRRYAPYTDKLNPKFISATQGIIVDEQWLAKEYAQARADYHQETQYIDKERSLEQWVVGPSKSRPMDMSLYKSIGHADPSSATRVCRLANRMANGG